MTFNLKLGSAFDEMLVRGQITAYFLFELETTGTTIRFWTGVQPITVDGENFGTNLTLTNISTVAQDLGGAATNFILTIGNVTPQLINELVHANITQDKPARVWLYLKGIKAYDDPSDPRENNIKPVYVKYPLFFGRSDKAELVANEGQAYIQISIEDQMLGHTNIQTYFYNKAYQNKKNTNDTAFDQIDLVAKSKIKWNNQTVYF